MNSESIVGIPLPEKLFAGKTAIITGSSRGVGRATAVRLAEAGANVVINYLSRHAEADEVVAECQSKGVEAIAVQADTSDFLEAQKLVQAAVDRFGGIDLLVLNAGIWEGAPIDEMTEEVWNKVLNTNLKSAWAMTKTSVPFIKKRASGSIVMVSSTAGQRGEAKYARDARNDPQATWKITNQRH